jgi:O-antigen/teichoic acid export membrane protein
MANQKNMGVNFIFSFLKTLMSVVFPLITFPYASRVLGPEYIGRIDYSYANVSYFVLIASFGISGYAIREGSKYRDNRKDISTFASEMLSINLFAVAVAYILFALFCCLPKMSGYRDLMLVFSVTILLTPLGVEWLYNIFEEYRYITVRAFIFQIIAVIILFTCVKDRDDYIVYAVTLILSSVGSNIANIIRLRRFIDFKPRFNRELLRHIRPMLYIFVMAATSTIYLVMDRSMLGYITQDDTEVGLYTTAVKVVTVITSVITSIRTVVIPRSAYYVKSNPEKSDELNYMTLAAAYMLSIPCAIGIGMLSRPVVVLFAGAEYVESASVLKILMFDLVFSVANGVIVNQIFIINKKEKLATAAIVSAAVVNLILNFILIRMIGKYGAAISTCVSELVIFGLACTRGRDVMKIERMGAQILQSLAACVPMVLVYCILRYAGVGDVMLIAGTVIVGAAMYFVVLFLLKNTLVRIVVDGVLGRLRGK